MKKTAYVLFLLLACIFNSCSTQEKKDTIMELENMLPDEGSKYSVTHYKELSGKFVKQQFVNKGGREIKGVFDIFFLTSAGDKYFVRLLSGKVNRDEIIQVMEKEVTIMGSKSYGLWDTDDPNVQSRIGEYLEIEKISVK